jgi:hypothetical protein
MDNFVGSMTEELKTQAILAKDAPLNPEGTPYFVPMTEERNTPSWYKGRPFLGILDENGTKYKEIGFHYQIDDDQLKRGFVSHGCVRVRDKDLYQLSALIFNSGQRALPVKVVNSFTIYSELFDLAYLDHPYPKLNSTFKRIIYADRNYVSAEARAQVNPSIIPIPRATDFNEVERYEWCRQNGKYSVLRYHGPWASVLGTDCLTRIATDNRPVNDVINYMLGLSFQGPQIAAHQYTTTSNYSTPTANLTEICSYNLGLASQVYTQLTSQILTYNKFKDICGCQRLQYELQQRNYKDGWDTFNRICR